MFLLKGVLRAETQEKVLIYLLVRDNGYAKGIADFYGVPPNPIQKQLARLESDGVIVSELAGQIRIYKLNPHYPFLEPLKQLVKAAVSTYPADIVGRLMRHRSNPRKAGRPPAASRNRGAQAAAK
jgi:hypothetical protein